MSTTSKGLYRHQAADVAAPGASAPAMLNKLADSLDTEWAARTPSTSGLTMGASAIAARWRQVGSLVVESGRLTLGAGFSMTAPIKIGLPVSAHGSTPVDSIIGTVTIVRAGVGYLGGVLRLDTASVMQPIPWTAAPNLGVSSTVPFTWAVNDKLLWSLCYEATA